MSILTALKKLRTQAYDENLDNIVKLLEEDKDAAFVDLGCDDGLLTKRLAKKIKTKEVVGFDLIADRLKLAKKKGIKTVKGDLQKKFPFKSNSFDVAHANQVIEHLGDTDLFVSEIYRILKPGGYAVVSTENLSSWHNIFALVLGYTPFSLTNISSKTAVLGNPFDSNKDKGFLWAASSWQHQRIFTVKGLSHLFKIFGFKVEKILTTGYYPLPGFFAKLDKYHSAFMTFKVRKEKK